MSVKIIGSLTALFGLAVIVVSSLVLYDAIHHKNRQWEIQQPKSYQKYGYDIFWDQFKFDDDILVVLTPLTLLVGIVQFIVPALFCCKQSKDLRKTIQLWLGTNAVLVFMALSCFVLGMVYRIDQVGIKTFHYDGRYSNTYLSSWWAYDKGQAYLGVLGCDVVILLAVIVWMIRWIVNPDNQPHSYDYEYSRGTAV